MTVHREVRAAQYLRMSTDAQDFSLTVQAAAIQAYAAANGYIIVQSYIDEGKSGLTLHGRCGLKALLDDVESGLPNFEVVIVYDVSRWGRFQDIDEGAHYEYRIRKSGLKIVYCAEMFAGDQTPISAIMKSIKRVMAAEYSRELSSKVRLGKEAIARKGFRQGGSSGLGLRRLMIDANGRPKAVLKRGERKSLQSDRVVLVPGPPEEVEIVRWMFEQYGCRGSSIVQIAKDLAESGVCNENGKPWSEAGISSILRNEKYIGNLVYGRQRVSIGEPKRLNPAHNWIRVENVYPGIVDLEVFEKVQRRFENGRLVATNEEISQVLRNVYAKHGSLSAHIIDKVSGLPRGRTLAARFGSMAAVYAAAGVRPTRRLDYFPQRNERKAIRDNAIEEICGFFREYSRSESLKRSNRALTLPNDLRVGVFVLKCRKSKSGRRYWTITVKNIKVFRYAVIGRMSECGADLIDFVIVPDWEFSHQDIRVTQERMGRYVVCKDARSVGEYLAKIA